MNMTTHAHRYYRWVSISPVLTIVLVAVLAGCSRTEFELVSPKEVEATGKASLGVRAKNPPSGLRFHWRAERGKCEPQESDQLSTTYTAPPEPGEDRVTLEVLQGEKSIDTKDIGITVVERPTPEPAVTPTHDDLGAPAAPAPHSSPQLPPPATGGRPTIRITQIPPYDPIGGPEKSEDIAGEVSGVDPEKFRVVLYARTDYFYVQPLIAAPFTEIGQDGKWSSWTHLGTRYAALLVKPEFKPQSLIPNLPPVGGDVVAIDVVMGKKK